MKHLTTLLLTLLVLGGCASTVLVEDRDTKELEGFVYQALSPEMNNKFLLSVNNKQWNCGTISCGSITESQVIKIAKKICSIETKGNYVNFVHTKLNLREDPTFYCLTEDEYLADIALKKNLALEREKREAEKIEFELRQEEERLLAELESRKEKCRTYGFKDDTDGMGMCLIELDKLAELEKQTKSIEANSVAQAEALAKQEADEKNRREAQILMNLGSVLSGKASCNFKCSGGQVVQGSCQNVSISVGNQICRKQ